MIVFCNSVRFFIFESSSFDDRNERVIVSKMLEQEIEELII